MSIIIQGEQNQQFQTRPVQPADGADDGVNSIIAKSVGFGNADEKEFILYVVMVSVLIII